MSTIAATSDVFLSYSQQDERVAEAVKKAFTESGLSVYSTSDLDRGGDIFRSIRTPLVESRAVVTILSQGLDLPPSTVAELGAAMAWQKPVFVLLDGVATSDVPQFLREFRILPMAKLPEVVELVRRPSRPFTEDERSLLTKLYSEIGVSADDLLTRPAKLDELTSMFNRHSATRRSGEQLARELLSLRKRGALPTIRSRGKASKGR